MFKRPAKKSDDFVGLSIGYFDIETTFSTQPRMLYGAIADAWGNVTGFRREDYPGVNAIDDSKLVRAYCDELSKYQILASWNGKLFDIPVLQGRLALAGLPPYNPNMHIDLMYYASGSSMRIGRRSLESVSTFFASPNRKTPLDIKTWEMAVSGDQKAYELIVEHCDADVLVTRDVASHLLWSVRNIHR